MEHFASAQKGTKGGGGKAAKAHLIVVHWHRISLVPTHYKIAGKLLGLLLPIIQLEVVSLRCLWLRDYLFLLLAVGASGWHFALPEAGKRRAEADLATSLLTKIPKGISLCLSVVGF